MLKLSKEKARDIVHGKDPDYEIIDENWLYEKKGLHYCEIIVRHRESARLYLANYNSGYKPSLRQSILPFDWHVPWFYEVERQEVLVKQWVVVDEEKDAFRAFRMQGNEEI